MGYVADKKSLQSAFILPVIAMVASSAILFYGMRFAPLAGIDGGRSRQGRLRQGCITFIGLPARFLALAWFSRIVDAAIGMPSVADISWPEWDRNPVPASESASALSPRVSIIVPARNEEGDIEVSLTRLLELDYDNYEIIAVNDRSMDRTGEIMEEVACRASGNRLRVIHHRELPAGMVGEDACHVDCK